LWKITDIFLNNFFEYFFSFFLLILLFFWAQPGPCGWAGPQPTCVAGLDLASPAWSLAHASDHPQKRIPLLGLKTGSLG